jgi:hypothetical protein
MDSRARALLPRFLFSRVTALTLAGLVLLLMQLLPTSSSGVTASHAHAPFIPVRDPTGRLALNQINQSFSANWSGYSEANFETGLTYTSATGKWAVPPATPVSGFPESYSSA